MRCFYDASRSFGLLTSESWVTLNSFIPHFLQIYERRLKQYQESLADVQPHLAASLQKKPRVQSGADTVQTELNMMNKKYLELLSMVNHYLKTLKTLHDKEGLYFPVSC